jgi:group II intron reverse transcriptase/maturase
MFGDKADKSRKRIDCSAGGNLKTPAQQPTAKVTSRKENATPAIVMEEVASVVNLQNAFKRVEQNKGAPGVDGQSVVTVRAYLTEILPKLSKCLLDGSYNPGEIRRVWIPKAGGGERPLGIPNVIDRVVQQALLQVMQPNYEPTFDDSSHGFRPGRSCHTAMAQAKSYVGDGYGWVVDIDLERFFDTVNHQRLQSKLEQTIEDKRIIRLIKLMLKAKVVMPDGVVMENEQGTPQGGPLSPLLSNIVLSELDQELRKRGHRFVRYADDCNIYVRSKAAAERVLESISQFIERRMRLKVNKVKSAVGETGTRNFLGFSLDYSIETDSVTVKLSEKSLKKISLKIVENSPRNWGASLDECILSCNQYLRGWIAYFKIISPTEQRQLQRLDAHLRRRLRAIQLKQWRRCRTIAQRLIQLGARKTTAWRTVYGGRKSLWRLSHTPVVDRTLRNAYFANRGLVSLAERWKQLQPKPIAQMQYAFV